MFSRAFLRDHSRILVSSSINDAEARSLRLAVSLASCVRVAMPRFCYVSVHRDWGFLASPSVLKYHDNVLLWALGGCGCLENEEMEVVACEVGKDPKDNLVMFHHWYLQAISHFTKTHSYLGGNDLSPALLAFNPNLFYYTQTFQNKPFIIAGWWAGAYYGMWEVREQSCQVASLLLPLNRSQGLDSGHQA